MRRLLLTLDTIDILCLVYSNFCSNKLSIKYQSYPKSRKMDAFEQKIFICHNYSNHQLTNIANFPLELLTEAQV